jgi:hypothetical protein
LIDITGQRFSRWTVIRRAPSARDTRWLCRCDCGESRKVVATSLQRGASKSCGCLQRELVAALMTVRHRRHGEASRHKPSSEYCAWIAMRVRCSKPGNRSFKYYGGRGIKVCDRWLKSYENFLADMGRKPSSKHSINRINNDGNYEPSNCCWATKSEQARNRRFAAIRLPDGRFGSTYGHSVNGISPGHRVWENMKARCINSHVTSEAAATAAATPASVDPKRMTKEEFMASSENYRALAREAYAEAKVLVARYLETGDLADLFPERNSPVEQGTGAVPS